MTWVRVCKDGLELNDGEGKVVRSLPKTGGAFPLAELLKDFQVPGNLVLAPNLTIRPNPSKSEPQKPQVNWVASPNYSYRNINEIDYIVLHQTVGDGIGALNWLCNPVSGVSAHYLILKTGVIYQLVKDKDNAWHCGIINPISIGIEHEARHGDQLTRSQSEASAALCRYLMKTYNISKDHVTGHRFTDFGRKVVTQCPGYLFGDNTEQALRQWVQVNL